MLGLSSHRVTDYHWIQLERLERLWILDLINNYLSFSLYAFMADPAIRSDRPTEIIKKSGRPEACIRGDWDIGPHGLEPG